MAGRARLVRRRQHVDRRQRLAELAVHVVGEVEPRPALLGRLGQDLVVDVGDVADERDVVALVASATGAARRSSPRTGRDRRAARTAPSDRRRRRRPSPPRGARSHGLRGSRCRRAGVSPAEVYGRSMPRPVPTGFRAGARRPPFSARSVASRPWPAASSARPRCATSRSRAGRARRWRPARTAGTVVSDAGVAFGTRTGKREYAGRSYERARWTRRGRCPAFSFTELIAVVAGDHARRQLDRGPGPRPQQQGRHGELGRARPVDLRRQVTSKRTTDSPQSDDLGLGRRRHLAHRQRRPGRPGSCGCRSTARPAPPGRRVVLARRDGQPAAARRLGGGVPARARPSASCSTCRATPRWCTRGHYPQWGSGGQAWCSPTSTSMVLGYYDALPPPVGVPLGAGRPPRPVGRLRRPDDLRLAATKAPATGPFNTAYAAPLAGHAFVTRLRSLREAEDFIAAGIPLVASISYGRGELDGRARLVDRRPPARDRRLHRLRRRRRQRPGRRTPRPACGVRMTAAQFENAWLPTSGGTVYVIHDAAHPLPPARPRQLVG